LRVSPRLTARTEFLSTANEKSTLRPDWNALGAELDQRAKAFNVIRSVPVPERGDEGLVAWQMLQSRRHRSVDQAKPTEWEWIFTPLINALLGSGVAGWVCLGHFVGTREAADRRWLYFLSPNYSPRISGSRTSPTSAFKRALVLFSVNAECRDLASSRLLLTTQMLDLLTPSLLEREGPTEARDKRIGLPLYLDFAKDNEGIHDGSACDFFRIVHVPHASRIVAQLRSPRKRMQKTLSRQFLSPIAKLLEEVDVRDPHAVLPFLTAAKSSLSEFAELYFERDLPSVFSGPELFGSSDELLLQQPLFRPGDPDRQRFARYLRWIFDVSPRAKGVLTIPAWLPSRSAEAVSGGLIVLLHKRPSLASLIGITNAFRLGCANWAVARGVQEGEMVAQSAVTHETQQLLEGLSDLLRQPTELLEVQEGGIDVSYGKLGRLIWKPEAWPARDSAIIPFGSLFRTGLALLRTWVRADNPSALPFDADRVSNFGDLVHESWRAIVRFGIVRQLWKTNRTSLEDLTKISSSVGQWELAYLPPQVRLSGRRFDILFSIARREDETLVRRTYWMTRLLLSLSREHLQHCQPHVVAKVTLEPLDSGEWHLVWTASLAGAEAGRSQVTEPLPDFVFDPYSRSGTSRVRGRDARAWIVRSIDPAGKTSEPVPTDASDSYFFEATFRWDVLDR
jgi:hypothetical protein